MECPVCHHPLAEFDAGEFQVDICRDGCSGMWFDQGEFEKCTSHERPFPEELLRVNRAPNVLIDRSKPRHCPKCSHSQMGRIELDPEINFEVDYCEGCHGYWLDVGELGHLRAKNEEMAEITARLRTFEETIEQKMKDPSSAARVMAFVKSLF